MIRDSDSAFLRDPLEQIPRDIDLVCRANADYGPNLELPLPRGDLGIDTGNREPRGQTRRQMFFRDKPLHRGCPDTTIMESIIIGYWPIPRKYHHIFLFNSKPWLFIKTPVKYLRGLGSIADAGVTEHQHTFVAGYGPQWIGIYGHWFQYNLGIAITVGLASRGAIIVPFGKGVFIMIYDACFRTQPAESIKPNIFANV
jgi:hypothetical protein